MIKVEESTDDEIQRTMERGEPEKNIDVESASPTNIPQNQKLIENTQQQLFFQQQHPPMSQSVQQSVMLPIPVLVDEPTPPVLAIPSPVPVDIRDDDLEFS